MVATVEEDAAGEHQQTAEEEQQYLQALLATVHEISIEDVGILGRGQSVLFVHKQVNRMLIISWL